MMLFLRKISDPDGLADLHGSGIRLHDSCYHLEKRGFPAAVGSDDSKALIPEHNIIKIFQYLLLTIALADVVKLYRLLPHPGLHRSKLHSLILNRSLAVFQRLKAFQSGLLLRRSGAASPLRPLQLHPENTLTLPLRGEFHLFPRRLQFEKSGIIRIIPVHLPLADLQNPAAYPVKEIPVMSHHEHGATVPSQVFLQPGDHLPVQMIGRLVQKQHVEIIRKSSCQHNPSFLSPGECFDLLLKIRDAQLHQICFHLPAHVSRVLQRIGTDIRAFREYRVLRYPGDLQPVLPYNLPLIRRLLAGDHLKQCGFSGSVDPDDPDLIPLLHPEGSVLIDHFLSVYFADMFYIDNVHTLRISCYLSLFTVSLLFGEFQADRKDIPVKRRVRRSSHALRKTFCNRKPKSCGGVCPCGIRLVKALKNLTHIDLLRVFRIIGTEEHSPSVFLKKPQRNPAVPVKQRVFNQILQDTAQRLFISHCVEPFLAEVRLGFDPLFLKFFIERKHHVINAFSEIHCLCLNLVVLILQPRICEEFLQHTIQAADPSLNNPDIFLPLLL